MDTWGALTNATSAITRDDLSIRRKTGIVSVFVVVVVVVVFFVSYSNNTYKMHT